MAGGRSWLRKATMLLALCAGSIGASVPQKPASSLASWTPDPEEQYILDVNICASYFIALWFGVNT